MPAIAIPYPLGNPNLDEQEEKKLRRDIVLKALEALETPIQEQTIFSVQ